ncbi:salivary glue protein Sgs-3 [Drosophila ficusphila]|uniref:salivary glue protein Sgs-3 n=1 Tax=Drosophila ficusphila TaxID=30025 RepID=UPI0007E7B5C5|nr:salivary glue protein Sgs-3 [Drosophila ficusphila]
MSKLTLIIAIACLCVAVQAQTVRPGDRDICQDQNRRCLENERRLGRDNDVSNAFNNHCRNTVGNWRNVSRCELSNAVCKLTLERCATVTCANVRGAIGGRTPPGGPTTRIPDPAGPRTTTRRNPTPRTSTRRSRTTTRIPDPAGPRSTTRRGRTTTRRTTTRRGRTTTRRTTTRRPLDD